MTYTDSGSAHPENEALDNPLLLQLIDSINLRTKTLTGEDGDKCVGSQLPIVNRALKAIKQQKLATGNQFCDWGSGLGGVCGVAALNGFKSLGIEFHNQLVEASKEIAQEQNLPITFCEGTFFSPGDETLAGTNSQMILTFDKSGWQQTELTQQDIDVVFSYPWPGEEAFIDRVFLRHAKQGALLMTFHGHDYMLVQQKNNKQLKVIGWY